MSPYLAKFLGLASAPALLPLFRTRNTAKEISEAWGILEAAFRFIPDLTDYLVIVVGDGNRPRCAALFAYTTKASTIAIDPIMDLEKWEEHCRIQTAVGYPVQRVTVFRSNVEDMQSIDAGGKPVLVVWPHSHAPMDQLQLRHYSSRVDIAMPCCRDVPQVFMNRPHISFTDPHVMSPKRRMLVWLPNMMERLTPTPSGKESEDPTSPTPPAKMKAIAYKGLPSSARPIREFAEGSLVSLPQGGQVRILPPEREGMVSVIVVHDVPLSRHAKDAHRHYEEGTILHLPVACPASAVD